MKLLQMFGWKEQKIIAENNKTPGKVTAVKKCWWLKINTKPVRAHTLDGAVFPHLIDLTYEVDGTVYHGRRYVAPHVHCPNVGETITIFYDKRHPAKYALAL